MPYGGNVGFGSKPGFQGFDFLKGLGGFGGGQAPPQAAPAASTGPNQNPMDFFGLKGSDSKSYAANIGAAGLSGIYGYGPQAQDVGFQNLLQILGSKGATDPALMNRQLADISRTNQGQQDQFQAQLARMGLGGSGVGSAISGAIGQHGGEQRAQAIAQETAMQEERKRQDLNLLLNLILNPGLGALGARLGVPVATGGGGNTGAAVLGGIGTGVGSMWGPAGAAAGAGIGSGLGSLLDK
jgi:hypothetical protein